MAQNEDVCVECSHCGLVTETHRKKCADIDCPKRSIAVTLDAPLSDDLIHAYFGRTSKFDHLATQPIPIFQRV